jgi:hypothetical protein
MTLTAIKKTVPDMGYPLDTWIIPKNIEYISLSGNNNRYPFDNGTTHEEYFFDTTNHMMLCREVYDDDGSFIKMNSITIFDEIMGFVMRNQYSEYQTYNADFRIKN